MLPNTLKEESTSTVARKPEALSVPGNVRFLDIYYEKYFISS